MSGVADGLRWCDEVPIHGVRDLVNQIEAAKPFRGLIETDYM
jgi:hypothetical protein